MLVNSDSSNLFNAASLQDESDDFSFCLCAAVLVWVLFVGMGMFVVGVDWLLDVSPSDKPDGSSRVLVSIVLASFIGVVLMVWMVDLIGDFSPSDKPDGSSRVLVSVVAAAWVFVRLAVFNDLD